MTLDEIRDVCSMSEPDDWHTIDCWSADSGPAYLNQWIDGDHRFHSRRAVLRADAAVGLAWGLTTDEKYDPPWLSRHWNNAHTSMQIVDTLYQGMLVDRAHCAIVDSGRSRMPLPAHNPIAEAMHSEGLSDYTITPRQYRLFLLIEELDGGSPEGERLDNYLRQAGFRLEGGGDPWME